jgi:hypothetical protein
MTARLIDGDDPQNDKLLTTNVNPAPNHVKDHVKNPTQTKASGTRKRHGHLQVTPTLSKCDDLHLALYTDGPIMLSGRTH